MNHIKPIVILFFSFTFLATLSCFGQNSNFHRGCASTIPFQTEYCGLHKNCQSKVFFNTLRQSSTQANELVKYKIKVAVHVIYHPDSADQNISEAKINSQIEVLNEDFRRTNADASNTPSSFLPVAADARIEFELDTVIRKETTKSSWNVLNSFGNTGADFDDMKFSSSGGSDALDTDEYLNIWVIEANNGLLGYAQFPPSLLSTPNPSTDGVVLDH